LLEETEAAAEHESVIVRRFHSDPDTPVSTALAIDGGDGDDVTGLVVTGGSQIKQAEVVSMRDRIRKMSHYLFQFQPI